MAINYLPEEITKEELFKYAQNRFQHWVKMYADPNTSTQYMYEDMCCSIFSGEIAFDFPNLKQDDTIRYQYKDGSCYFIVDGIEVSVYDLRSMRESPRVSKETYVDVCIPCISYADDNGNFIDHPIPNAWLYGSTSNDFDEGKEVHPEFINAAREYIKEHNITKEMQEYDSKQYVED